MFGCRQLLFAPAQTERPQSTSKYIVVTSLHFGYIFVKLLVIMSKSKWYYKKGNILQFYLIHVEIKIKLL